MDTTYIIYLENSFNSLKINGWEEINFLRRFMKNFLENNINNIESNEIKFLLQLLDMLAVEVNYIVSTTISDNMTFNTLKKYIIFMRNGILDNVNGRII